MSSLAAVWIELNLIEKKKRGVSPGTSGVVLLLSFIVLFPLELPVYSFIYPCHGSEMTMPIFAYVLSMLIQHVPIEMLENEHNGLMLSIYIFWPYGPSK